MDWLAEIMLFYPDFDLVLNFMALYTYQSRLWSLLRNGSLESLITLKAQDLDWKINVYAHQQYLNFVATNVKGFLYYGA